jgi:acetyltransferase-like isoleucine patch superfamily enzyme
MTMNSLLLAKQIKFFRRCYIRLRSEKLINFERHVSVGDLIFERDETAKFLGFGEGTTCYNNVLVIGDVSVGKNTWIGPNVILDGSGGLVIGDHVSISAGVQIYTHHTVNKSVTLGSSPVQKKKTIIGNGVYIGPNSVIQMGVTIGDSSVIGALSLVNRNIPPMSKAFGTPAIVIESP